MIGIFDSGIGGLTVVRALRVRRPDLPFVYLGDTARAPYGTKGPETIRRYSEECARFLIGKGAGAIVIACNTASALATEHLRATFPDTPVFEVIAPAVEAALASTRNDRIGVIGTRATVASGVYEKRLKAARPGIRVHSNPAPLLVSLVEENWLREPETEAIVGKYLAPLAEKGVDALILGCTHYPILKSLIATRLGPGVALVDSAEAVAAAFCATIEKETPLQELLSGGASSFFVTDPTPAFAALGSAWLGLPVAPERASL